MKIERFQDPASKRWKWRADFTHKGKRHRPVADSKGELEDIIDAVRRIGRQERYGLDSERPVVTLAELVSERIRDLDLEKSNDRRKKVVMEMFRDHFDARQEVERLTRADLLSYKRERVRRSKLRPNSINRELEAVTAMLRAAGLYFPSLENWRPPAMPYEKIPDRGRERVWTEDEENKLLFELKAERRRGEHPLAVETRALVADFIELAMATGMRLGEIEKMEKGFIDWKNEVVNLPARVVKTKTARTVPLNPAALEILRARSALSRHPRYVFTNSKGTGLVGRYKIYRCLRGAAKRAGVPYGSKVEGGFTFHDSRHTAATRMLHDRNDLATVGEILGHTRKTMTLLYAHASLESKRRAVASLVRDGKPVDKNPTEATEEDANPQSTE